MARLDLGPHETYMLTDPRDVERALVPAADRFGKPRLDDALYDLLGDGLLLSNGETWERQRDPASPSFHARRVAGLGGPMVDHAEAMLDGWDPGDRVGVHAEMARVTVRIIASAMFGTAVDDDRVTTIRETLEPLGRRFEPDPVRTLVPDLAPTRENREFHDAVGTLREVIGEVVAERRGTARDAADPAGDAVPGDEPMDLLSVLLRARPGGADRRTGPRRDGDDAAGWPRHHRARARVRAVPPLGSPRGARAVPRRGGRARRPADRGRRPVARVHRPADLGGDTALPPSTRCSASRWSTSASAATGSPRGAS